MPRKPKIELSIIVPAFEEEALIESSLTQIAEYLGSTDRMKTTEIIVVNADGNDATRSIAESCAKLFTHFTLITPGSRVGKGRDVRAGFQAATGDMQVFTDADLATPLTHIDTFISRIDEGADVVIGERNLHKIHKDSLLRRATSRLSNLLIQTTVLRGIHDTQCGFKGFTKEAAHTVFSAQTILGWGFDIEILKIARIHKLTISTIAITDWHDPKGDDGLAGDSQLSAMIKTLTELARIRINAWKGIYS